MMKKIGVVTSGGDAPGMNAAIRAVSRLAHSAGMEVIGYRRGWDGIVNNRFIHLSPRSVSNIVHTGGTMLHTCRCPDFKTPEAIARAAGNLSAEDVEGLVVIGGDGSFRAAQALSKVADVAIAGVPATIDNDVYGTDDTIGFDTAVNTNIATIDKIRDTATALDRIFIVEVMGRTRGFIAAMVGLTSGAEIILVPEVPVDRVAIYHAVTAHAGEGKKSGIIVAAEGVGDTGRLARDIEANTGLETRLSIVGYAQRGGSPTARSRYLANMFGDKAVQLLADGHRDQIAVIRDGRLATISLEESSGTVKPLDMSQLRLADALAR
jgi:6-phosphofructokinase 1